MKLRVVFLCDEYPPFRNGGIGTYTKEVAERLVQKGHEVTVIGIYPVAQGDTDSIQNGVRIICLNPSRFGIIGNRVKVFRAVQAHEKMYGIDILESQDFGGNLAGWPKTNFKTIVRLHGSITNISHALQKTTWKNHIWKLLESMTLKRADHIVSVSQYTADRTKHIFGVIKPIDVIHNGIMLPTGQTPRQEQASPFRVVFAGSLLPMKGFLALIRAWRSVLKVMPDAKLHIAGKDSLGQLSIIDEILDDSMSITYHGVLKKSELEKLYRTMNLGVFPSFIEAFSLAPMEAMAVGLPVIYTELASGRELIEDGVNGILIDPNDEPSIARAILSIAQMSTADRSALGLRGQKHIQNHFSIDRLINDNETLMHKLLEHKHSLGGQ